MMIETNPKRDNLTINVICVAISFAIFIILLAMYENRLAEIAVERMV